MLGFKELSIFLYPDNSSLCSGLGCSKIIHYFCLCCSCFSLWCQLCSSWSSPRSHVCQQNHSCLVAVVSGQVTRGTAAAPRVHVWALEMEYLFSWRVLNNHLNMHGNLIDTLSSASPNLICLWACCVCTVAQQRTSSSSLAVLLIIWFCVQCRGIKGNSFISPLQFRWD